MFVVQHVLGNKIYTIDKRALETALEPLATDLHAPTWYVAEDEQVIPIVEMRTHNAYKLMDVQEVIKKILYNKSQLYRLSAWTRESTLPIRSMFKNTPSSLLVVKIPPTWRDNNIYVGFMCCAHSLFTTED